MTLLEIVQNILSDLDSDEVNSISDTTESLQIANIVKTKYNDIVSRSSLPEHHRLIQLNASGDSLKPVLMYAPAGTNQIDWIKYYNADPSLAVLEFEYVRIVPLEQFLSTINQMNPNDSNVGSWTFNEPPYNFNLRFFNDKQPQTCAILENYYILFDMYNSAIESTLQTSNSMVSAQIMVPFTMTDTFVPDIDDANFALLLAEAKSNAFVTLKQTVNPKIDQETKRQWSSVQKNKGLFNAPTYFDALPHFGRK
ncbi:MAG TPA: hypothetical protein VGJ00_04015 [Rhabdochlamydiaceae bacterium]|jgi:hypothetical protein